MQTEVKKEIIFPVRIIFSENAEHTDYLLQKRNIQVVSPNLKFTLLNHRGKIVLDFGKEVQGCLRLLVNEASKGFSASKVRISLGESVAEAITPLGKDGAGNYHSVRDGEYYLPWNTDFTTARTGFRFALIELLESDFLQIECIVAETEMVNLERKGFFLSNDELLNKIADTAAYTATLCVQNDVIWDGIKRDRMVWTGDLHPEIMTIASLYGAIPQIKNSLDYIDYYFPHSWINSIPAYSAWWIICLAEYYKISADKDFVLKKIYYISKICEFFDEIITYDGKIVFENSKLHYDSGLEFYFDWPTFQTDDGKDGWISLIKYAMETAVDILVRFGQDANIAKKVSIKIAKNKLFDISFKQVAAFNLFSGRKTTEETKSIVLSGGAYGMTGFMGYYILTSMAQCGGKEEILKTIKDYYGGMLSLGATTFWEDFDIEWIKENPQSIDVMPIKERKNAHRDYGKFCYTQLRHSLCHGWTSGVYAFLVQTVLGIVAVEPGYKKVRIAPNLIGLKYVEGSIPTPFGEIHVKHELINGEIYSEIHCPDEILIVEK